MRLSASGLKDRAAGLDRSVAAPCSTPSPPGYRATRARRTPRTIERDPAAIRSHELEIRVMRRRHSGLTFPYKYCAPRRLPRANVVDTFCGRVGQ
jgi:hypothetical protein